MIPFSGGRQLANGRRTGLGSGFGGVVAYLTHANREDLDLADAEDRVAWTATRNLDVDEPEHAVAYMRAWASQNPRVKEPVYHFGASLAPDEHLTREQWEHVADHMLERLGLVDHQAFLALHVDRDHEHIHIVVNRVGPDVKVWKPSFDVFKQQDAARELESELGLRVVPTLRDLRREQRQANDVTLDRREVEKPFARRVARAALVDFRESGSWEELEDRLAARGLRLEPARRGGGVNVTDGKERAGLARVDRSLSGPRLADRYGETCREYLKRHPDRPKLERAFERPDVTPALPLEVRAENLVRHLANQHATWSEQDLRRLSDRDLDGDALLRQALESEQVVTVGTGPRGENRFATRDYVDAEQGMFRAAERLAGRGDLQLPSGSVAALVEERFVGPSVATLSHEQQGAVIHATTGRDLALVVGRAGAGKTRLTRAVAEAYREAGYRVQGAALAGKAAEGLATEAGLEARTLASYIYGWKNGTGELSSRDVLLVDEAGMIDVRKMRRVLEHAEAHGAKVVLLGDPDQLKAIDAGDALRGLVEEHGAARVDTIRRQADAWQRQASEDLADGRLEPALRAYAEYGGVQWHTDPEQARDALVMRYFEDRYLAPDQSSLILAHRRSDVRRLNERIREVRRDAGELGPGVRLNGREFAAGDRMLFLRNDNTGRQVRTIEGEGKGVKNGTLGTLLEADATRLRIRLDSGRMVELDPRLYDRLDHGYAATVHKAQGVTVDRAYVLAGRGFDRNLSYVALTRHRHQLMLYADLETFDKPEKLTRVLAREPRKDLVRDYRPLDAEAPSPVPAAPPELAGAFRIEPSVELTPERIEQLETALSQLECWDEITVRSKTIARSRHALPHHGSLPDLRQAVARLESAPRHFDRDLERVYRDPGAARRAFDRHARDTTPAEAFQRLAEAPESFGRLAGRRVLGRPTKARAEALDGARRIGVRGTERQSRLDTFRRAFEDADRYRLEGLDLAGERAALALSRNQLVERLRGHAVGLDLDQLDGRLAPRHLRTLRDLEHADRLHLAPLREALESFRAARRAGRSRATVLGVASKISSLLRTTPRSLLRRLVPQKLRIVLSATAFAVAALKKIAAPEQREEKRRILRL